MICAWCHTPIAADYPIKEIHTDHGSHFFHKLFFRDCYDFYEEAKERLEVIGKEAA